jgi:hypothetical protein
MGFSPRLSLVPGTLSDPFGLPENVPVVPAMGEGEVGEIRIPLQAYIP